MISFRAHAIAGVKWTGGSTAFGMALQFIQMAVLARYLSIEAFGLFGETMVVVGIAISFVDLGFSPALVQKEGVDNRTFSSLFWIVAGVSVASGLIVWGASTWIAMFFEAPALRGLLFVAAVFVAVFGVGQVPLAVLQKHLAFDRLSKVDMVSGACGVAAAVACAKQGMGAHAPVYGLLVSGCVRLTGLMASVWSVWRPSLHLDFSDARPFLSFGAYQTGERFVNYLASNLDFVMIGKVLGAAALGPYYVAYQVVVQPMVRLTPILTRVAFPLFSKVQNDDALICRGYLNIVRLVALISLPLLIGMAVVAPTFFHIYLGKGWSNTALLAQILVAVSILKCLGNPLGSAFLAKGRPDIGFKLNTARFILNALLFWWAVQSGLQTIAFAYVGSSILAFWVGHVALSRVLPLNVGSILRAVTPTLFAATTMGILVALAQIGLTGVEIDPIHRLAYVVSLGGTVYMILLFKLERPLLLDIRRWVMKDAPGSG